MGIYDDGADSQTNLTQPTPALLPQRLTEIHDDDSSVDAAADAAWLHAGRQLHEVSPAAFRRHLATAEIECVELADLVDEPVH